MGRGFKIIITIIVAFILGVVGMVTLAFSKGGYQKGDGSSLAAMTKIREGEKTGKEVEITKEELNEIIGAVFKKDITKGDITVKTPEGFLEENYIGFKAPVTYKGKELLLSTKGELKYEEGKIEYLPQSFKVGKLPLPKFAVLSILSKYIKADIIITKNSIMGDKKLIPFSINSLNIRNGVLYMTIDKFMVDSLFDNGKDVKIEVDKLKEQLKNIKEKSQDTEIQKKIDEAIKIIDKGDKTSNEVIEKIKEDVKNIDKEVDKTLEELKKKEEEKLSSLKTVRGQLAGAIGSTGSSKGDEILSIMISTMENLISNPSYSYSGDVGRVKNIYSKLSSKEKDGVKKAILSNVNLSLVSDLRATFGI